MHSTPLPQFFASGFFVCFLAMWGGISFLLSWLGGWLELARRFRNTTRPEGKAFHFVSATMRRTLLPVNYGHCLTITVGPRGLWLKTSIFFRAFNAPIFLPWSVITAVEKQQILFFSGAELTIDGYYGRIKIWRRAGREILAQWERRRLQ